MPVCSAEQQQAGAALSKLREKIEDFHTACHDLQTLKIAEVVTLMATACWER
jgi:hypothetical protein